MGVLFISASIISTSTFPFVLKAGNENTQPVEELTASTASGNENTEANSNSELPSEDVGTPTTKNGVENEGENALAPTTGPYNPEIKERIDYINKKINDYNSKISEWESALKELKEELKLEEFGKAINGSDHYFEAYEISNQIYMPLGKIGIDDKEYTVEYYVKDETRPDDYEKYSFKKYPSRYILQKKIFNLLDLGEVRDLQSTINGLFYDITDSIRDAKDQSNYMKEYREKYINKLLFYKKFISDNINNFDKEKIKAINELIDTAINEAKTRGYIGDYDEKGDFRIGYIEGLVDEAMNDDFKKKESEINELKRIINSKDNQLSDEQNYWIDKLIDKYNNIKSEKEKYISNLNEAEKYIASPNIQTEKLTEYINKLNEFKKYTQDDLNKLAGDRLVKKINVYNDFLNNAKGKYLLFKERLDAIRRYIYEEDADGHLTGSYMNLERLKKANIYLDRFELLLPEKVRIGFSPDSIPPITTLPADTNLIVEQPETKGESKKLEPSTPPSDITEAIIPQPIVNTSQTANEKQDGTNNEIVSTNSGKTETDSKEEKEEKENTNKNSTKKETVEINGNIAKEEISDINNNSKTDSTNKNLKEETIITDNNSKKEETENNNKDNAGKQDNSNDLKLDTNSIIVNPNTNKDKIDTNKKNDTASISENAINKSVATTSAQNLVPKTSDTTNPFALMTLMAISITVAGTVVFKKTK